MFRVEKYSVMMEGSAAVRKSYSGSSERCWSWERICMQSFLLSVIFSGSAFALI